MTRTFGRLLTILFAGSCLLPVVTSLASDVHRGGMVPIAGFLLGGAVAAGLTLGFRRLLQRVEPALDDDAQRQASFLDSLPSRWVDMAIAGAAGVSLLLELSIIRWQGGVFSFLAFYTNFGLLACFAGLGLGYALASRDRIPLALVVPLLAWQFALLTGMRFGMSSPQLESLAAPVTEQLYMGLTSVRTGAQVAASYFFLSVVFLLSALTFVPVGQLCGRLMGRRGQLRAYGLNLLGSLAGVLLMFAISSLWTPPVVWYALPFVAILLLSVPRPATILTGVASVVTAVVVLVWPVDPAWQRVYSPYQLIELGHSTEGLTLIRAAGHYFQRVHDLSPAKGPEDPGRRRTRSYYDLPYLMHSKPADVAVVGAGSGNDVAAALRAGVARVDAIEIDPAVLMTGRLVHPEHPYRDQRVHAVVNDARSFLRTTDRTYDLIVYGLLDSHTLLSQGSSIRLDSYVYTLEAFREARTRLKPGGTVVISFSVITDAMGRKMYEMLRQAFDEAAPTVLKAGYDGAITFVQSKEGGFTLRPEVLQATGFQEETRYATLPVSVDASTDDWPFFYMPKRVYPVSYLLMLGMVLVGALALTRSFITERPQFRDVDFFLLGAGFMLVETKAITEMGLTFGSTWRVIGIVIAGILVMAFFANAAVQRLQLRRPHVAYGLLLATLALGWVVMGTGGLPSTTMGRLATVLLLTSPMFFSGIVFSTLLSTRKQIAPVMAANLLGAMCGGLLEYNSMYFGYRFLYLLAMGLYGAAFVYSLTTRRSRQATEAGEVESEVAQAAAA